MPRRSQTTERVQTYLTPEARDFFDWLMKESDMREADLSRYAIERLLVEHGMEPSLTKTWNHDTREKLGLVTQKTQILTQNNDEISSGIDKLVSRLKQMPAESLRDLLKLMGGSCLNLCL